MVGELRGWGGGWAGQALQEFSFLLLASKWGQEEAMGSGGLALG